MNRKSKRDYAQKYKTMIFLYLKWYLISWIVGFIGLVIGFDIPLSLQGAWGNTYALILWAFMVPPIMGASVLGFVYFLFKLEPFLPKGYKRYDAKKLNSSIIIFLSVIALILLGLSIFYIDKYILLKIVDLVG